MSARSLPYPDSLFSPWGGPDSLLSCNTTSECAVEGVDSFYIQCQRFLDDDDGLVKYCVCKVGHGEFCKETAPQTYLLNVLMWIIIMPMNLWLFSYALRGVYKVTKAKKVSILNQSATITLIALCIAYFLRIVYIFVLSFEPEPQNLRRLVQVVISTYANTPFLFVVFFKWNEVYAEGFRFKKPSKLQRRLERTRLPIVFLLAITLAANIALNFTNYWYIFQLTVALSNVFSYTMLLVYFGFLLTSAFQSRSRLRKMSCEGLQGSTRRHSSSFAKRSSEQSSAERGFRSSYNEELSSTSGNGARESKAESVNTERTSETPVASDHISVITESSKMYNFVPTNVADRFLTITIHLGIRAIATLLLEIAITLGMLFNASRASSPSPDAYASLRMVNMVFVLLLTLSSTVTHGVLTNFTLKMNSLTRDQGMFSLICCRRLLGGSATRAESAGFQSSNRNGSQETFFRHHPMSNAETVQLGPDSLKRETRSNHTPKQWSSTQTSKTTSQQEQIEEKQTIEAVEREDSSDQGGQLVLS